MLGIVAYLMIDILIDFAILNVMFCDVAHGQRVNWWGIAVIWGLLVLYMNCCRQVGSVSVYRNEVWIELVLLCIVLQWNTFDGENCVQSIQIFLVTL